MKKLILTEPEQAALAEAWNIPDENPMARIAEYKFLCKATPEQSQKFYQMLIEKTKAEQRDWREWFIKSGIIRWLVLCEAEKGLKGLGKRIKAEWGELADEYDLKEQFNKAYTDVIDGSKN